MEMWNFLAGGAALGLVAGFWDKIKAVVWKGANLFVQQVELPTEAAHSAVVSYLIARYARSRLYDRMYGACYEHTRDGKYGLVAYEQFGNRTIVFWDGWRPFIFSNEQEKKTKNTNASNDGEGGPTRIFSTLTFLRGSIDVEQMLRDACAARNKQSWAAASEQEEAKSRFRIHYVPSRSEQEHNQNYNHGGLAWYQMSCYRLLSYRPDQLGKAAGGNGQAIQNLIFPQRVKDLIQEIELWRGNRQWYLDKAIPWKRGWMLYGPPGTGKTALARAFAEDLNLPIYVYNLTELDNHELTKAWSEMQVNIPCIALIEDIDNVFHGRQNVARNASMMPLFLPRKKKDDNGDDRDMPTPLTFDALLNCLDGVERSDGIFTIITTNDISKIDPALGQPRKLPDGTVEFISTRPGRIDKAVELTFMEVADKKRMAQRILGDYPDEYRSMLEFIDRYADLQETPAQFQERCGQIALARFWRDQQAAMTRLLVGEWDEKPPAERNSNADETLVEVG